MVVADVSDQRPVVVGRDGCTGRRASDRLGDECRDALGSEGGLISLTDTKGRKVLVPAAKVAYIEIVSSRRAACSGPDRSTR